MKKTLVVCVFSVLISGCAGSSLYAPELQSKWQGRDVTALSKRMGGGTAQIDKNGQKYYAWYIHENRQPKSNCQLRAFIDSQNKIIRLENYSVYSNSLSEAMCKSGMKGILGRSDEDYAAYMKKTYPPLSTCQMIWGKNSLICM